MKAVGEAKGSSASAQWAAAVIGAALSTATGGDAQSGASIAANAIKNNHLDEELIAQNSKAGSLEDMKAILEANQKVYDYDKTFSPEQQKIFENLETNGATNVLIYETFDLLVDKQIIDDPRNISKGMDYRVYKITMPIKNIPVTLAVIADRYSNVYSAGEISSPGFTGASFSVSYYKGRIQYNKEKDLINHEAHLINEIPGLSAGITVSARYAKHIGKLRLR